MISQNTLLVYGEKKTILFEEEKNQKCFREVFISIVPM